MDTRFEDIVSEIRQAVSLYAGHVAVVENGVPTMTYQEWWHDASCLAEGLRSKYADAEYVIVELPKSASYVVSLLACWMTGKPFVPLGADLPAQRKDDIKRQLRNYVHLTADTYSSFLSPQPLAQTVPLQPDTPAYLIFSSGTTGTAKGIVVGHSGLVSLARCQRKAFGLTCQSRSLFFLSVNFDASISDILTTLTSGAALVIESTDSLSLSASLMSVMDERRITHADLPPSLLRVMDVAACPASLQTIIIGGEATDSDTVRKWATRVRLINVYGPTEATVCTSLCQYGSDWSQPVVGKELEGVEYHICRDGRLDADEGELWISGPCLAIGYYDNQALTEAKFPVVDGTRYYRTADHVRRLPNGDIAYLGRYDRQVKIHGQLVELEEVEAHLKRLPLVRNVAVVKRPLSGHHAKEALVAFIEAEETTDNRRTVSTSLRHHLPTWMIPSRIVFVDRLPRVASGKVDLRALERLPLAVAPRTAAPYGSAREEAIARLMADVLKMERVNPHDDFLELGADSLDTLLLIARLQNELGISVTLAGLQADASPAALSRMGDTSMTMAVESSQLQAEWAQPVASSPSGNVPANDFLLITGATGFLGSHLLMQVLCRSDYEDRRVVCLVRCDSPEHGEERLRSTFRRYGLPCSQWGRVEVVPSDLSKAKMGLDDATYQYLADRVTVVFHCAATVNMMADYAALRASNVWGTRRVAEFCLTGCRKQLNYASTLSVFVSTSRCEGVAWEHDRLEAACTIYGGYGQTKFVCEKLLMGIAPSLCGVNIIRYGLLCGDSTTGISAPKDFLGMFLRGAAAVGSLPWDGTGRMGIDITPVDMAASITLDIATASRHGIYHVAAENPLRYNHLCRLLSATLGLTVVKGWSGDGGDIATAWQPEGQETLGGAAAAEVAALRMSLCRMDADSYERLRHMDLFQTTDIRFDMTHTHRVTPRRIYQHDSLIKMYIEYETAPDRLRARQVLPPAQGAPVSH